jgi:hypothetical protein
MFFKAESWLTCLAAGRIVRQAFMIIFSLKLVIKLLALLL